MDCSSQTGIGICQLAEMRDIRASISFRCATPNKRNPDAILHRGFFLLGGLEAHPPSYSFVGTTILPLMMSFVTSSIFLSVASPTIAFVYFISLKPTPFEAKS